MLTNKIDRAIVWGNLIPLIVYFLIAYLTDGNHKVIFPIILIFISLWTHIILKKDKNILRNTFSSIGLLVFLF